MKNNLSDPLKRIHEREYSTLFSDTMKVNLSLLNSQENYNGYPIIIANKKAFVSSLSFIVARIQHQSTLLIQKEKIKQAVIMKALKSKPAQSPLLNRPSSQNIKQLHHNPPPLSLPSVNPINACPSELASELVAAKTKYIQLEEIYNSLVNQPQHNHLLLLQSKNIQLSRRVALLESKSEESEELAYMFTLFSTSVLLLGCMMH